MTYAKGTKTSIATSEQQIKAMLQKAGADTIAVVEGREAAQVAFHLNDRQIKFTLPLPKRDSKEFTTRPVANQFGHQGRAPRAADAATSLWMQASRERWRQLHLCIKAKLESVEQNIETFDEAFLPHIIMGNGQTVGQQVIENMQAQLAGAPPRPLLLGHG